MNGRRANNYFVLLCITTKNGLFAAENEATNSLRQLREVAGTRLTTSDKVCRNHGERERTPRKMRLTAGHKRQTSDGTCWQQ